LIEKHIRPSKSTKPIFLSENTDKWEKISLDNVLTLCKFPPIPGAINEETCYIFDSVRVIYNGINVIAGSPKVITINYIVRGVG